MADRLTPPDFVAKWSRTELSERAASQEHFIDICRLLGQPTPAEHDATGAEYTFEKSVTPLTGASKGAKGDRGFVDVWWKGRFGWEYKRKDKYRDLAEAYRQLQQYREAIENPPLLIVCDITRIEIHTNFTGTAKKVHVLELVKLAEPKSLDLLRRVFTDPQSFKPDLTPEKVTEDVAKQFATLAKSLRAFGYEPQVAAHFLMKCMFCLFAEDVKLLPGNLFTKLVERNRKDPAKLTQRLTGLFALMRTGGEFGADDVPHFNGGLFDDQPALRLTAADIQILLTAADSDWGSIEPAIFGTLFERSLDPNTRAQIGAHYTGRDDIMLVVEPVVMAPLRREWNDVRSDVESHIAKRRAAKTAPARRRVDDAINHLLQGFVHRLATVRILDPACGSGNFLYVAIQQLLTLEKEVITFAARPDIAQSMFPRVRPTQLHGIEINPYAAELAQVVIWIGYLQWMKDNGFLAPNDPILEPLQTIECRDAILDLSNPKLPAPAKWPEADFIIGNPPFLGRGRKRNQLGSTYCDQLNSVYDGNLKGGCDLCCYWFELARRFAGERQPVRVGLLATQGIRGGTSRAVLESIASELTIFFAYSDHEWVLDGAQVHVSIVGFARDTDEPRFLDGQEVDAINADLTAGVNIVEAQPLNDNSATAYQGVIGVGDFELDFAAAREMIAAPNPTRSSNADVVLPSIKSQYVGGRDKGLFVIYFHDGLTEREASQYQAPFEHLANVVRPIRNDTKYARPSDFPFWQMWNSRRTLVEKTKAISRYFVTARHSKYRLFRWVDASCIPDDSIVAFAMADDFSWGVMQSSIHVYWSTSQGTQVREIESGKRYTPRSSFETFPLPWPPGKEPTKHAIHRRISDAAEQLNEQRERWLNPPEWIDPIARAVDADDDFRDVPEEARPLIRQSAIMARAGKDPKLKKRTLTNLYNERPTWLKLAHEKLDRAVLAAYAEIDPAGGWSEDWARVWIDTGAGQPLPAGHTLTERRAEIDQLVLANLLRLNLSRAQTQTPPARATPSGKAGKTSRKR